MCGCRPTEAHLGADAQVRIGNEFRRLVRVFLRLHVGVGHADGHTRDGQDDRQDLPGPRCETQAVTEARLAQSDRVRVRKGERLIASPAG